MSAEVASILSGWLDGLAWLLSFETATRLLFDTVAVLGPLTEPS